MIVYPLEVFLGQLKACAVIKEYEVRLLRVLRWFEKVSFAYEFTSILLQPQKHIGPPLKPDMTWHHRIRFAEH
jgi:hypothetical protein